MLRAAVVLLCLGGILAGGVWLYRRPPAVPPGRPSTVPPDPRLTYSGPWRNIHPDVACVGDASCAECHADKAATYRAHPMGRALQPIAAAPAEECGPQQHNPFTAFGAVFRVDRQGDRVWHRQSLPGSDGRPLYEASDEVHFVIGSGNHGHSYLTSRDGYLFQTAISWYSREKRWDVSPGFSPGVLCGRPIGPECLFCHSNGARHVAGSVNRYEGAIFQGHAIGCERCHGPGQLHAQTMRSEDIVHPARLAWRLREAVCEQCHLEGEAVVLRRGRGMYDYRPGLPLEQFRSVFVHAAEAGEDCKAVNHVEQMYQSACFRASPEEKKLGCTSCHDPHVRIGAEKRVPYYRAKCLACHGHEAPVCSLPLTQRLAKDAQDSCIGCHMPRFATSDIPHNASTDHRIPRRPASSAGGREAPVPPPGLPIVSFYRERLPPGDREDDRDLGIALAWLARQGRLPAERYEQRIVDLLESALRRAPDDLDAWEAKGQFLGMRNRPAEALAAFASVLARAPRRESSLAGAAAAAELAGQAERARDYLRRVVAANPWNPLYRENLVRNLAAAGAWEELGPQCEAWLRLAPGDVTARRFWIDYLKRSGRAAEAREETTKVEFLEKAGRQKQDRPSGR